jgi:uncharacterized RDD family membrane protein YckC
MTCPGCGHNYANTITRCPRCKLRSNRMSQRSTDSRLIEFPRKPRAAAEDGSARAALPPWRTELNEKVRAIRARRSNPALQPDTTIATQAPEAELAMEAPTAGLRQPEPAARTPLTTSRVTHSTGREAVKRTLARAVEYSAPELPPQPTPRSNDVIVEKALTRVRRASENASRATLPKIEPVRQVTQKSSGALLLDKEATARALEPPPEVSRQDFFVTQPLPEIERRPITVPEPAARTKPLPQSRGDEYLSEIERSGYESVATLDDLPEITPLDELEPLDYLEAEVRKVERNLRREQSPTNAPSMFTHLVIHGIDLIAIAVCALPFVALIGIYNGNYSYTPTRVAAIGVTTMIGLLYFGVTQCLGGKTFGMMLTNAHIADAQTLEPVTPPRAILRSIGYIFAIAPALLGLLLAATNPRRRGLQDYISGTQVVRDF